MWFYIGLWTVETGITKENNFAGDPISFFQNMIIESVKGFEKPQLDDFFSFSFLTTDLDPDLILLKIE